MYTFTSRIRYSETDEALQLTVPALVDYFQDCTTFQAEDLGIGLSYLGSRHLAWILNYWQIEITRRPSLGDTVRIGTSPYALHGFIGERNFLMEAEDGTCLARAASLWSLMDLAEMRPMRITQEMKDRYELFAPFDMDVLPRKIALPEEGGCTLTPVTVERAHLDSNHHVNNARYVQLSLAALEEANVPAAKVSRLRVEYCAQAHLGDTLTPVYFAGEDGTHLLALCGNDGKAFSVTELLTAP